MASYITLYCGLFFNSGELSGSGVLLFGALLIGVNVAYVCYFSTFLAAEFKAKVKTIKDKKKKKGAEDDEEAIEMVGHPVTRLPSDTTTQ